MAGGLLEKFKAGLEKTRKNVTERIDRILVSFGKIDEELFEELEDILIASDAGAETALKIMGNVREMVKEQKVTDPSKIRDLIKAEISGILGSAPGKLDIDPPPAVIIVIGVNGAGKTTSIGKMAHMLVQDGRKVVIAAADTFRAAAIDQLKIWAEKAGADLIGHKEGADPGAVVYDAIQASKSRKADVLIIDTAGRLHTKKNLMEELKKISKIIDREMPEARRETLLVLDASTGQNAIQQAKIFNEAANVTGIILAKLDGTAKGGIVIAIRSELDIPVKFAGIGEKIDDLKYFDSGVFIDALF